MSRKLTVSLFASALTLIGLAKSNSDANANTLSVSVAIPLNCTIAPTSLGFDNYSSTVGVSAQATIGVSCTSNQTVNVSLNGGANEDTAAGVRRLKRGTNSNFLQYILATGNVPSSGGATWAPGASRPVVVSGASGSTNGSGSIVVFGEVPSSQGGPAGNYTDIVDVTVSF